MHYLYCSDIAPSGSLSLESTQTLLDALLSMMMLMLMLLMIIWITIIQMVKIRAMLIMIQPISDDRPDGEDHDDGYTYTY